MAEELVMNVKSNIKAVTKETKDWGKTLDNVNESLNIQNKVITDLERDLIKLKAKQDAIPKGAFYAGMGDLNKKIKETSNELKLEKLALKDLTNQQKEASGEVKKYKNLQKESNKESKESIANFQFMGVSLKGIQKGFSQIIPTAKAMFGTIRAGIMSTGIGALVLGVIALTQSFKRSEEGQEKFQRIMAGIGAVTSQVLDLFADLGETIIDTFTNPLQSIKNVGKSIGKFLKNPIQATTELFVKATVAVKTFADETKKEIEAIDEVTKARQKAHHIDRKLKVERANANREINDIRLQAEDREKLNATERIALLRKAQKIEEDITAKEIKSKQLLIDAQVLEMAQGKNSIEQKDKLAQLQAELINLDTKKLRGQRLLQTQITTALNEEKALKEQAAADAQKIIDDEFDAMVAANDEWNKEQQKKYDKEVAAAKKAADEKIAIDQAVENAKIGLIKQGFGVAQALAGENAALSKGVAVAQTVFSTQQAIMAALAATSVGDKLLPYPLRLANAIGAGLMGAIAIKNIMSTSPTGGGANVSAPSPTTSGTPAPQMMSGAFELSGGQAPEPLRAYVLTDEMTNSQNQLANIRRRATI